MKITFPEFTGVRCLMMPYVQGDPDSVPRKYHAYANILESLFVKKGDVGFLTIDESRAAAGRPHRGDRAKHGRALHTEVGIIPGYYCWGGGGNWGGKPNVTLDRDVKILLANSVDDSCAIWAAEHPDTSVDGDIGFAAAEYTYANALLMKSGQVEEIGILTPHESVPVKRDVDRQFLRIMSSGVYGREAHFTQNPLMPAWM